jgi:simple sugar transport system substrate-binding protein
MRRVRTRVTAAGLFVGLVIVIAACGSSDPGDEKGSAAKSSGGEVKLAFVCGTSAMDPFYAPMQQGAKDAADEFGVDLTYTGLGKDVTPAAMSKLLTTAVNGNPDALVVCNYFPSAMTPIIKDAIGNGIRVIETNSAPDVAEKDGAIVAVGQDDLVAGQKAGEQMVAAGVTHPLCVNQNPANPTLVLRCKGIEQAFKAKGLEMKTLNLPTSQYGNVTAQQSAIKGTLSSNRDIDGVLALGPQQGPAAARAVEQAGLKDKVKVSTFDVSKEIAGLIQDGTLEFTVWQQPYLQGYLPVIAGGLATRHGFSPSAMLATGPTLVTKDNVDLLSTALDSGLG